MYISEIKVYRCQKKGFKSSLFESINTLESRGIHPVSREEKGLDTVVKVKPKTFVSKTTLMKFAQISPLQLPVLLFLDRTVLIFTILPLQFITYNILKKQPTKPSFFTTCEVEMVEMQSFIEIFFFNHRIMFLIECPQFKIVDYGSSSNCGICYLY